MVRLYAKEAAEKLQQIFVGIGKRKDDGSEALGTEFSESAKSKLDNFFAE
jgi:hypothetical protein